MKKRIISILMIAVLIFTSAITANILSVRKVDAAGGNLLVNPSFETGDLSGWTTKKVTSADGTKDIAVYDNQGPKDGSYCTSGTNHTIYQAVTIPVTGTYSVSGWFKSKDAVNATIKVYKDSYGGTELVKKAEVLEAGWKWKQVSDTFDANAGDTVVLEMSINTNGWTQQYYDGAELSLVKEQIDYVGKNLLTNSSFETGDLSGWTTKKVTSADGAKDIAVYDTQGPKDGSYCTYGTNHTIYQAVTIPVTGTYSVSGWFKSKGAENATIKVYKDSYGGTELVKKTEVLEAGWKWKQVSDTFDANAGDTVVLEMSINTNGWVQQYYDGADLSLVEEKKDYKGVNLLQNADFEKGIMDGWSSANNYSAEGSCSEFVIDSPTIKKGWGQVHGGNYSAYAQSTKLYQTVILPADGTYIVSAYMYANDMDCILDVYSGAVPGGTVLLNQTERSNKVWTEVTGTFSGKKGDVVTFCCRGWQGNNNPWLSLGVDDTKLALLEEENDGNLLVNGGFETGDLTSWTASNSDGIGVFDNQNPVEGKYCTFGTNSKLSQQIVLKKSGTYSASAQFNSKGAVDATLNIYKTSLSGKPLASVTETLEGSWKWKKLETTFSANAGDVIIIELSIYTNGWIQQFYDDAKIKLEKEVVKENLLKNAGFESGTLDDWTVTKDEDGEDGSASTVVAHSGSYSALLTDTKLSQDIVIPKTGVYSFGGWADANLYKTVSIIITDTDNDKKLATAAVTINTAWTWNEMSGTFWAKAGTKIKLTADFSQTQWAHSKYFDDAYLYFEYEAAEKPRNGIGIYNATPYGPNDPLWENVTANNLNYAVSYQTGKTYNLSELTDKQKKELGLTSTVSFKIVSDSGNLYINYYIHDEYIVKERPMGYQWFQDWAVEGIYSTTHDGVKYANNYYSNYYNMNRILDVSETDYIGMRIIPLSALTDLFGANPEEFSLQIDYRDTAPKDYKGAASNTYHFCYKYDTKQSIIPFYFKEEIVPGTEDNSKFVPVEEPEDFKAVSVNMTELAKHQEKIENAVPDVMIDETENIILVGNFDFSCKTVYNCLTFGKGVNAQLVNSKGKNVTTSKDKVKDGILLKLTLPDGKTKEYKLLLTGSF